MRIIETRSPYSDQYIAIRLLTLMELSLSCTCANTADSASSPLPVASVLQEKQQLDSEIKASLQKFACASWGRDNRETLPALGTCRFASFNANGCVLVDHADVVSSFWNRLHDLGIISVAIQDTKLQSPDKQIAAQK